MSAPTDIFCSFNQQWINKALIRTDKDKEKYDIEFARAGLVCNEERFPVLGTLDNDHYNVINMAKGWGNGTATLDVVFTMLVEGGFPISTWVANEYRNSKNFIKSNLAMVDIDGGLTITDVKAHEFYQQFGAGYYTSPSHTEDAQRLRLLFLLEDTITSEPDMRAILNTLINIFNSDGSCRDASRLFYGSKGAQYEMVEGKCVPSDVISILIEQGKPKEITLDDDYDYGEVTDIEREYIINQLSMTFIGEYDKWLSVCAAMQNSGYTVQEFTKVTVGGLMRRKTVRDCEELWKDIQNKTPTGRPATMGTVWKLIGGVKLYRQWLAKELEKENDGK